MRLFHVSEEAEIQAFHPRRPSRTDLDPDVALVWAIDEDHLPNFLTPRDCPRVCYHVGGQTTEADRERFFTSRKGRYAVVIEHGWFHRMAKTTLYLYEFDPSGFELQDNVAGYYVAKTTQYPMAKHRVDDLFGELFRRGVELRVTDSLWDVGDAVKSSTLDWSLCRMANAQPRYI